MRTGRLSRHVRPGHAGPHGYHPAGRQARRPARDRGDDQSIQIADVHCEERIDMVRREIAPIRGDIHVVSFDSLLMDFRGAGGRFGDRAGAAGRRRFRI
jgi:hypothetical protein